jgi:hypothetical protein
VVGEVDEPRSDEVETSLDPYDDLTPRVAASLEAVVLRAPTYEAASAALEALEYIVAEWDELEDDALPIWASANAGRPLTLGRDSLGNPERSEGGASTISLSAEVVNLLISDVLASAPDARVAAIEAIRELAGEWGALLVDDEKLVGHLILKHHHVPGTADPDILLQMHAECHSELNHPGSGN